MATTDGITYPLVHRLRCPPVFADDVAGARHQRGISGLLVLREFRASYKSPGQPAPAGALCPAPLLQNRKTRRSAPSADLRLVGKASFRRVWNYIVEFAGLNPALHTRPVISCEEVAVPAAEIVAQVGRHTQIPFPFVHKDIEFVHWEPGAVDLRVPE